MQASDFINNHIPPLKLTDTAGMALTWMEEMRTNILPLIDQGMFLGLIRDEQLLDISDPSLEMSEIPVMSPTCWVYADKHIYDVLRVGAEQHSNIVAVLDRDQQFIGITTMEDSITAFADSLSIQSQGSVLILSILMSDYSLAEIARIIESENTKILSSFLTCDPLDSNKIKLTLKLDKPDIRHVKATLERFEFKILDHYQEETGVTGEEERIGNLLRFLDI